MSCKQTPLSEMQVMGCFHPPMAEGMGSWQDFRQIAGPLTPLPLPLKRGAHESRREASPRLDEGVKSEPPPTSDPTTGRVGSGMEILSSGARAT